MNSELSETKLTAEHFRKYCNINQIDETHSSILELALVEALNNIIIHAYDNKPGFEINAEYEILNSNIIITLTDFGKEFEKTKVNDKIETPDLKDIKTKELTEGSWGIGLMQSIADDIIRLRENNMNTLKIIKKISP